ncbi:MAG: DUF4380 domain-containing protein [Prevotella sp.]|jgi:hypothetical protein|nr:DUF4380 domain-containing protein [Prevotella sp.]
MKILPMAEHWSFLWNKYLLDMLLVGILFASCSPGCITRTGEVYTLKKGDLSFSVSADKGGRIVSFKRGGCEILTQESVHPNYYGATLWTSPQKYFWPPSPVLDKSPYTVEIARNTLRLTSKNDTLTGLRFIKEFSISESDTSIVIHYIIENISDTVRQAAAWDVVRVLGGLSFFPLKDRMLPNLSSDLEAVSEENGLLWYDYSPLPVSKGQKLFATTSEGWLAHRQGGLLFIKRFPEVSVSDLPEMQGEAEIFLAPQSLYVELENHSACTRLEKGRSLSYRQQWHLLSLPENGTPTKEELAEKVRNILYRSAVR